MVMVDLHGLLRLMANELRFNNANQMYYVRCVFDGTNERSAGQVVAEQV
jgi:hypothetical protein